MPGIRQDTARDRALAIQGDQDGVCAETLFA